MFWQNWMLNVKIPNKIEEIKRKKTVLAFLAFHVFSSHSLSLIRFLVLSSHSFSPLISASGLVTIYWLPDFAMIFIWLPIGIFGQYCYSLKWPLLVSIDMRWHIRRPEGVRHIIMEEKQVHASMPSVASMSILWFAMITSGPSPADPKYGADVELHEWPITNPLCHDGWVIEQVRRWCFKEFSLT